MARKKLKAKNNPILGNNLEMIDISPITPNQEKLFERWKTDKSQLILGSAGTGKTWLSIALALQEISDPNTPYRRLVIVRSAVPTRDIGFLKGTDKEKGAVYELPYEAICTDLFSNGSAYEILTKHHAIEFMLTSFIRGLTIDNAIIVFDEFQNATFHEADSVITRVGMDSKVIFCGDILQRDLTKQSEKNIEKFVKIIEKLDDYFEFTYMTTDDIVRSGLTKAYIKCKEGV